MASTEITKIKPLIKESTNEAYQWVFGITATDSDTGKQAYLEFIYDVSENLKEYTSWTKAEIDSVCQQCVDENNMVEKVETKLAAMLDKKVIVNGFDYSSLS